jgi:hypothetical protein
MTQYDDDALFEAFGAATPSPSSRWGTQSARRLPPSDFRIAFATRDDTMTG